MAKITVSADRELVERVMRKHGLRTRARAVEFALHQAAGYDPKKMLELQGTGWDGDLEQMRRTRNLEC